MTIILATILAGCGGGGSSTTPAGNVPAAPVVTVPAAPVVTQPAPTVPAVQAGNWVIMGSSTAAGNGAAAGKGWAALLQAEWASKGDIVVNIAKPGVSTYEAQSTASTQVANRPLPDATLNIDQALARKPTLLILAFPSNDTASGYSTDETVKNLLAIRAKALATSVPVIVVSTQPRGLDASKLSQLRDIDERMANEVGTCFVPIRAKLAGADARLAAIYDSGDGAHPNDLGHALIAGAIDEVLRSGTCVRVNPS